MEVLVSKSSVASILRPCRRFKPPRSLLAGYGLFAAFLLLESAARQGAAAKASTPGAEDRGTTRMLGAAYGAGVVLLPIAAVMRGTHNVPALLGPILMLAAIALRMSAAVSLGRFYTRTLRTAADQPVVRDGPYRFVRHPGYLGTLLMWTGFGICTRDWLIGALCGTGMWLAYRRRIAAEEAMLVDQLGDAYREYMRTTPALLPLRPGRTLALGLRR
jgi:protein-S-isoprenylcysteine O-methyltransferase